MGEEGDAEPVEVGDGREKHVTAVTRSGTREEHAEVYLRHSNDEFIVSPDPEFPPEETTRYRKADLRRVEVVQHHAACFITTATAGEGTTLDALRRFRDDAMRRTVLGRALVRAYYALSPPVARTLARHPASRTARVVGWLVERCAGLERRRQARDSSAATLALSVALTLLYVAGLALALAGHAAIRAREVTTG